MQSGFSKSRVIRPVASAAVQSVIQRLPEQLSDEDAAVLAAADAPPYAPPDVPGVVIVPGSGPHTVDYSSAGALHLCQKA